MTILNIQPESQTSIIWVSTNLEKNNIQIKVLPTNLFDHHTQVIVTYIEKYVKEGYKRINCTSTRKCSKHCEELREED